MSVTNTGVDVNGILTSTGATSLATGGGVVNISKTGVMTTVKGTLNVNEAATFDDKVGIGTTSPGSNLDVRGNMRLGDGSTAEQDIRYISQNGDWQVGTNNGGNGTNSNQFYIYDSSYRLTVQKGTGRVGIGVSSPGFPLHVSGLSLIHI